MKHLGLITMKAALISLCCSWCITAWVQEKPTPPQNLQPTEQVRKADAQDCLRKGKAERIRDALLAATYVGVHLPAQGSALDKTLYDKIFELTWVADDDIDLFECMNDEDSLWVFANLGSYYIGESAGEEYDCLALQKGKVLLPYLDKILETKCNECTQRFGARSKMCREPESYLQRVKGLAERIRQGKQCDPAKW